MSLQVSRILHAGYVFEHCGTRIMFDPIFEKPFSQNCYAFPDVNFDHAKIAELKVDAVFISHFHEDHFSLKSLNHLRRDTPIYMYTVFEEHLDLIRKMGFVNVEYIYLHMPITVGGFLVRALEALDAHIDSLFHIQVENLNILNVVDSWLSLSAIEYTKRWKWDLVLWPFQTFRELAVLSDTGHAQYPVDPQIPTEWKEQIQMLNPRALIASSCQFKFEKWSWYNDLFFPMSYKNFFSQLQDFAPKVLGLRLAPGESLSIDMDNLINEDRLSWVHLLGDPEEDYVFKPDTSIPPLKNIIHHFEVLRPHEKSQVRDFCEIQISIIWQQLPLLEDSFFKTKRCWRLKVYDENGFPNIFDYSLSVNDISPDKFTHPDWETEILERKLHGALFQGESLTSIYVRIHAPKDQDQLEDPLLRTLYEGKGKVPASYCSQ